MLKRRAPSFAPLSAVLFVAACASSPGAAPSSPTPSESTPGESTPSAATGESVAATPETENGNDPESAPSAAPNSEERSRQDELRVGEVTDGVTLTSAEVEALPRGAYKLVLSFDGKGPPPVVRSRVENPKLVVIVVEGVRRVTANLPVVTGEGGTRLHEPRVIHRGPVESLGRGFYGDDSGIRIDVELSSLYGLELLEGTKGRSVELVMDPKN